jgi:predicted small metal-binding protein
MKKFTCREMGGPCDAVIEGETAKEVGEKGAEHVKSMNDEAHKAVAAKMNQMSEEDNKKWWEDFYKKFAEKPES